MTPVPEPAEIRRTVYPPVPRDPVERVCWYETEHSCGCKWVYHTNDRDVGPRNTECVGDESANAIYTPRQICTKHLTLYNHPLFVARHVYRQTYAEVNVWRRW